MNNLICYKISLFLTWLLGVICFFPQVRAFEFVNYLWLVSAILFFVFSFIADKKMYLKLSSLSLLICVFVLYSLIFPSLFSNYIISFRFLEISIGFLFYFSFLLSYRKQDYKGPITVLIGLLPFLILTLITTTKAYLENPLSSRLAKKGTEFGLSYLQAGVGGYEFIYALTLLLIILYFFISSSFRLQRSFINFFVFIVGALVVFTSNFATAFIILGSSLFILFLFRVFSYKVVYLIVLFIPLLLLYLDDIFIYVARLYISLFPETLTASKLFEIINLLEKNIVGDSMSSREDTFMLSINTFLSNPIFGVVTEPIQYSSDGFIISFGQHSQILDTFALFGLLIGVIQVVIVLMFGIYVNRISEGVYKELIIVMVVSYFSTLTFNNTSSSIGLVFYYVLPTFLYFNWRTKTCV